MSLRSRLRLWGGPPYSCQVHCPSRRGIGSVNRLCFWSCSVKVSSMLRVCFLSRCFCDGTAFLNALFTRLDAHLLRFMYPRLGSLRLHLVTLVKGYFGCAPPELEVSGSLTLMWRRQSHRLSRDLSLGELILSAALVSSSPILFYLFGVAC